MTDPNYALHLLKVLAEKHGQVRHMEAVDLIQKTLDESITDDHIFKLSKKRGRIWGIMFRIFQNKPQLTIQYKKGKELILSPRPQRSLCRLVRYELEREDTEQKTGIRPI